MAMNVGSADGDEDQVVSTINTTPLVDVMLVLLIIFLITIPVVTTSIPVTLPKERNEIRETKPENIVLSVDSQGRIYWNDLRIPTTAALLERLKKISVLTPRRNTIPWARSFMRRSGRASRKSALSPSRHRAAEADMPKAFDRERSQSWQ
jgi:biopolymer transport protein ExbD